ncbi:MAG: cache domain-containing protein, partial [Amphritea sp.]|nr:cache domain-containing protein [Amphritea sp.]
MTLSISKRLTIMSAAPVVLLAIILFLLTLFESEQLRQEQLDLANIKFVEMKREELKFMNEMAYSAVRQLYENGGSLEEALPTLRTLKFGDNGYFFGYTGKGDRVFLGNSDKGIGENYWDLKDANGVYLVRELVKAGQNGGGIVSYHFPKPNQKVAEEKLSYAFYLERWDLMIGTGFYLDDVNAVLSDLDQASS